VGQGRGFANQRFASRYIKNTGHPMNSVRPGEAAVEIDQVFGGFDVRKAYYTWLRYMC
jgi:hypothetical protein